MARTGRVTLDRVSNRITFVVIPDSESAEKTTKLDKLNKELEELTVQLKIKETKAKLEGIVDQSVIDQVRRDQLDIADKRQTQVMLQAKLADRESTLNGRQHAIDKKEADWKEKYGLVQHDLALIKKYYQDILKQHPGMQALVEPKLEIDSKWWSGK